MDMVNLSVIRQSFGNVVYTHKTHEISAEGEHRKSLYIKITNIFLVALVLIAFIVQIFRSCEVFWSYMGAGLTISEIIFLIIQLSFPFSDNASKHKSTALCLLTIREEYIALMADIINKNLKINEIRKQRDKLLNKLEVVYKFAPQTTRASFEKAQKLLSSREVTIGEDFTFSDAEIDRFLPSPLKISNIKKNSEK